MARIVTGNTPKKDGYRMPGEFEEQERIWMIWPERQNTWRENGIPAQEAFTNVAKAILEFEKVSVLVSIEQYGNCRKMLPKEIELVLIDSDDAWCRDSGPTFLKNSKGKIRACDWGFNAWGGKYDGLYDSWEKDALVASQICDYIGVDYYKTPKFILEGGSIHVDGEGTVITTEMCLLSRGRNPHMNKQQIENMLKEYLNCEKVIWVPEGIDPQETNGHIDDVAAYVRPGEVVCIYTEDINHPFYKAAKKAYETLSESVDAKSRKLKVHKLCCTRDDVRITEDLEVNSDQGDRKCNVGDLCIASYANFLLVNGGVIVPQYGDVNDALAIRQLQEIFPERKVVGVMTREIVYGGGNIHCITQQQPCTGINT